MYDPDADKTLQAYFGELKPERRLELLDSIQDNEASEFLLELFHGRYPSFMKDKARNQECKDVWLWRALCLQMLYNKSNPLIFRKSRTRELNAILDELCMNDESHSELLYHEYRNVARRYLSTCRASGYASSFMGFRQASDDEKILRACRDVWEMSEGIARRDDLTEKMRFWCYAFRDELMDYDPVCRAEYQRLSNNAG